MINLPYMHGWAARWTLSRASTERGDGGVGVDLFPCVHVNLDALEVLELTGDRIDIAGLVRMVGMAGETLAGKKPGWQIALSLAGWMGNSRAKSDVELNPPA